MPIAGDALQSRQHIEQRTHVGRLLLHPDDVARISVAGGIGGQLFSGNGYICSTKTIAVDSSFLFLRSPRSSCPIFPLQTRMRSRFADLCVRKDVQKTLPREIFDR